MRKDLPEKEIFKCDLEFLSNCDTMIIKRGQEINPSYPNH